MPELSDEDEELKHQVFAILKEQGLENMTKKKVRLLVEKQRGEEPNALKSKKSFISQCIDDFMEQQEKDDGDASDSGSASDEPEPPPKNTKKRKKAPPPPAPTENKKKPLITVQTRSGAIAPKKLKERQCDMMTAEEFLQTAPLLEVDVFGNKISGEPRSFTSGNKGWYCGGKIEVPIAGKVLWGQLGLNLSLMGSKEW